MTKTKLTPEQEFELEVVGAEMALSGYPLTKEALHLIGERYYASDEPETIRRLVEKAHAEGRPTLEVFLEHYGPPAPPKQALDS